MLVANEVQGVRHENPVDGGEAEARAPQIFKNLTNYDSVILLRNCSQRTLVKIYGMNCASGS